MIQRYLIVTVGVTEYNGHGGQRQPEKVLMVESEKTKKHKVIMLRQTWFDSPCSPGIYISLIGDFDQAGQCVVDDSQNLIILHPDHLVSATVVGDSFECVRRAVLQDRVKATNSASESQVYGQILHEIFQEALKANQWHDDWMDATIKHIVSRHLEELYEINISLEKAIDHLKGEVVEFQAWAELFVASTPKVSKFHKKT